MPTEEIDDRRRSGHEALARIERLESHYEELQRGLQRVELEQSHVKEVLGSRFDALNKGQEILSVKLDGFGSQLVAMSGDVDKSPAGRQVMREFIAITDRIKDIESKYLVLAELRENFRGGLRLAQYLGIGGLLMAGAAVLRAFGMLRGF